MPMTKERGYFITLEGIDGTGKTTQAKLLVDNLRKLGFQVLLTREPGGTALSERIRTMLLQEEKPVPLAELLLYNAARAQHVAEVIRPALQEGKIVVCERFSDSTLAYQGYGSRLDPGLIQEVNRIAADGLVPDCTFLLVLEPQEVWERIRRRDPVAGRDRMEAKGLAFLERVQEGYLELARAFPERIVTIRCGGKPVEEIQKLLLTECLRKLEKRGDEG